MASCLAELAIVGFVDFVLCIGRPLLFAVLLWVPSPVIAYSYGHSLEILVTIGLYLLVVIVGIAYSLFYSAYILLLNC